MDLVLDIKDLVVHYETEDSDVHAVNGIDIAIGKKRTLGLAKPVLAKLLPHCLS
mgnify:CR=1 FL=1